MGISASGDLVSTLQGFVGVTFFSPPRSIDSSGLFDDGAVSDVAGIGSVASAIGGLRQGALALTPTQEAVLDLAVEQVLSPALTRVNQSFVGAMLEQGIPLEAVMTELVLSGEIERSYRLLREVGYARQMEFHSPTSQYGQLSRRDAFAHLDPMPRMRELVADIASGRFADEWDEEARTGGHELARLKALHCSEAIRALEAKMREQLGPAASGRRKPSD
jgi:ketol-acid reductoisomerase